MTDAPGDSVRSNKARRSWVGSSHTPATGGFLTWPRRSAGRDRIISANICVWREVSVTYHYLDSLHIDDLWNCCAFGTPLSSHKNSRDSPSQKSLCNTYPSLRRKQKVSAKLPRRGHLSAVRRQ